MHWIWKLLGGVCCGITALTFVLGILSVLTTKAMMIDDHFLDDPEDGDDPH